MKKQADIQNLARVNGRQMLGLFKGLVVDNRDVWGLGRVRIWCYALHGDFATTPINALLTAEPLVPLSGSFTPPPLFSKVWFGFEAANRDNPVYIGFWYGIPNGVGRLPSDKVTGTDVRPEGWDNHDLTPESIVLACSAEGNAVWVQQKFVGQEQLHSAINLMDTGGKSISIKSYHTNTSNYAVDYNISVDSNDTMTDVANKSGFPNPTRDGTDIPTQATGSIDIGHQNSMRSMKCNATTFSQDSLVQYDDQQVLRLETQAVQADILLQRCGAAMMNMGGGSIFMNAPNNVFINNQVAPPRRYIP